VRRALLLTFLLGLGCSGSHPTGGLIDDEYAVYSTVINQQFLRQAQPDSVLVAAYTRFHPEEFVDRLMRAGEDVWDFAFRGLAKAAPSAPRTLVEEFRAENRHRRPLARRFQLKASYELWTPVTTLDFSSPLISLSGIAFDPGRTQALVMASILEGSRSGAGVVVFLIKEGGRWTIRSERCIWLA
jgi:hypothetical protein